MTLVTLPSIRLEQFARRPDLVRQHSFAKQDAIPVPLANRLSCNSAAMPRYPESLFSPSLFNQAQQLEGMLIDRTESKSRAHRISYQG